MHQSLFKQSAYVKSEMMSNDSRHHHQTEVDNQNEVLNDEIKIN